MQFPTVHLMDYKGESNPEALIPQLGSGFYDIAGLEDVADLLKRWQFKSAYDKLAEKPASLDTVLLKAEMLTAFEYYDQALDLYEQVLESEQNCIYALTMAFLIETWLQQPNEEKAARLKKEAPRLYADVKEVLRLIEIYTVSFEFKDIDRPLDAICVYGYVVNDDGTLPPMLVDRLKKAEELARLHPEAKVLLSGGAVQNRHSEAAVMKNWLMEAGIDEERLVPLDKAKDTVGNVMEFMEYIEHHSCKSLCAVTTFHHLPRAWLSLKAALYIQGYETELFGAAWEESADPAVLQREAELTFPTVLRSAGLFTKEDIENRLLH